MFGLCQVYLNTVLACTPGELLATEIAPAEANEASAVWVNLIRWVPSQVLAFLLQNSFKGVWVLHKNGLYGPLRVTDVSLQLPFLDCIWFSYLFPTPTQPPAVLTQCCFRSEHPVMLIYWLYLCNLKRVRLKTTVNGNVMHICSEPGLQISLLHSSVMTRYPSTRDFMMASWW